MFLMSCVCYAFFARLLICALWERADLLALVCGV